MLTRTLNRLNLLIKVSDYQVAAYLLGLPSEITSDNFAYIKPNACIALSDYIRNKESKQIALDRLRKHLNDRLDSME